MKYSKESVMNALRMAGQKIKAFDEAYAERAAKDMGDLGENPLRHMLGASPVFADSQVDADTLLERILGESIIFGARASNAGYRYGLPAAGVVLGGKGIYDITQGLYGAASATPVFGGPEDGQQPGQLPFN